MSIERMLPVMVDLRTAMNTRSRRHLDRLWATDVKAAAAYELEHDPYNRWPSTKGDDKA